MRSLSFGTSGIARSRATWAAALDASKEGHAISRDVRFYRPLIGLENDGNRSEFVRQLFASGHLDRRMYLDFGGCPRI